MRCSAHSRVVITLICLYGILTGCATAPRYTTYVRSVDIRDVAAQYRLRYDADFFLETVKLEGDQHIVKGLIDSSLIFYNGAIYDLKGPIEYRRGSIFIPDTIHAILTRKEPGRAIKPALLNINTVIIDAGHGGKDPGARYGGLDEKDLNLRFVKLLKKELEKYGITVHLTRTDDRYVPLKKRVRIAADSDADFFVSIHMNASRNKRMQGFEVYYLSERFISEQSKELVYKENAAFSQDIPEQTSQIIKDMLVKENGTRSLELAHSVYRSAHRFGLKTHCIRGAPFYVLKYNHLPAILVEVAYLSNTYERSQLLKESFINQVVEAVTLGIINLKKRYSYLNTGSNG